MKMSLVKNQEGKVLRYVSATAQWLTVGLKSWGKNVGLESENLELESTCLWGELSLTKSLTTCLICKMGTLGGLAIAYGFSKDQMT